MLEVIKDAFAYALGRGMSAEDSIAFLRIFTAVLTSIGECTMES